MTLTFSAVTADMDSSRFPSAWRDFAGNLVFIEQPKHAGSPAPAHKRGNTAGSSIDQSIRENLRVTCFIQTRWVAAQLPVIRYNFSGALNGGGANDVE
jgi:hypothetical protein